MEKTIHCDAYKVLREWLVQARNDKKLTQRQLAELLEVPHSWVAKVEQGERRLDVVEYLRVCRVLGANSVHGLHLVEQCMDG